MADIVRRAQFGHIYISYSTDGIMDYKELCAALKAFGTVECFFKPYKRYKSNNGGAGNTNVKEIIIYVKKDDPKVLGKNGVDLGERGIYDKRNQLNDLTGKEWFFYQFCLDYGV